MIMYTSGTSGLPKGVIATQRQLKEAAMTLTQVFNNVMKDGPNQTYIAYLPQAHILEATIELFIFLSGVKIGFATPFTLSESAPGLANGTVSDLSLLRPTLMAAVPLMLDRIQKGIYAKLAMRTPVLTDIFNYLMDYKFNWSQRGYSTPIVNHLLCGKVRQQLGGNIKYILVGGAPLSPKLHSFIKCSADVTFIHGYGATETCGAVLCTDYNDLSYGRVGAPVNGVKIKLIDWDEGEYFNRDKPHPRGEIVVGGKMISNGYFKLDELNEQSFYHDTEGLRWFKTGDIGEIFSDGTFKIIDRKKDLIKLANGEFISLGKIEAALKNDPFVDNVCVVGKAIVNHLVALLQPNQKSLVNLCKQLQISDSTPLDQIYANADVVKHIHNSIIETGRKQQLRRTEIPSLISISNIVWSPHNGLLTGAMKLKRTAIVVRHRENIEVMFKIIKIQDKEKR